MIFPGLNSVIFEGDVIMQQRPFTEKEKLNYLNAQKTKDKFQPKRYKIHPLHRGWTGGQPGGRKIGPPDPIDDCLL